MFRMLQLLKNKRNFYQATLVISFVCILCLLAFNKFYRKPINSEDYREITDFSGADNETGFPFFVVPNIVHLVHFTDNTDASEKVELSFIEVVTIRAAHQNQKPEKIMIHCNCYEFHGEHWNMVKDLKGLEVAYIERPRKIFGNKLGSVYHASDVARIVILMRHGGIYIDTDIYIVKLLDKYRRFEMSLGWEVGGSIKAQAILANKNARFLKLYYDTYRKYNPKKWKYNSVHLPTMASLDPRPELVHRVSPSHFGFGIYDMLFGGNTDEWKTYDTIHLLTRHPDLIKNDIVPEFNLDNIKVYNRTFGQMARLVLYGTTELIS